MKITPSTRPADVVLGKFRARKLRESDLVRLTGLPRGRFQYAKRVGHFRPRDQQVLMVVAQAHDVDLRSEDFVAHLRAAD